jgi:serine/threonine protein phosphatase PrpC
MKRCSTCGARVSDEFRYCEADGTLLVADDEPPAAPPPVSAAVNGAATCLCGQALDDGDGFCTACGHRIRVPSATTDRASTVLSAAIAGVTDRGHRHPRNEDALVLAAEDVGGCPTVVLVVCDGVTSSAHADLAAAAAARTARDALTAAVGEADADLSAALADAIRQAHQAVCELAPGDESGKDPPGTTIIAAVIRDGRVGIGWVGDSRAYRVAPAGADRLTRDHSWAEEAIASGEMTPADAYRDPRAHAITHCLGPLETFDGNPAPEPSLATLDPSGPGWLILCTDGFWNGAPEPADVARLVAELPADADASAIGAHLVDHALARGGLDNITVALARLD